MVAPACLGVVIGHIWWKLWVFPILPGWKDYADIDKPTTAIGISAINTIIVRSVG